MPIPRLHSSSVDVDGGTIGLTVMVSRRKNCVAPHVLMSVTNHCGQNGVVQVGADELAAMDRLVRGVDAGPLPFWRSTDSTLTVTAAIGAAFHVHTDAYDAPESIKPNHPPPGRKPKVPKQPKPVELVHYAAVDASVSVRAEHVGALSVAIQDAIAELERATSHHSAKRAGTGPTSQVRAPFAGRQDKTTAD